MINSLVVTGSNQ